MQVCTALQTAILPCNLLLISCFADINVLRGSVATYARCSGTFNIHLTANLPKNLQWKNFWNRLRFDRIMLWVCGRTFSAHRLYITIAGSPQGRGKMLVGSWKVLEKSWNFLWPRECEASLSLAGYIHDRWAVLGNLTVEQITACRCWNRMSSLYYVTLRCYLLYADYNVNCPVSYYTAYNEHAAVTSSQHVCDDRRTFNSYCNLVQSRVSRSCFYYYTTPV